MAERPASEVAILSESMIETRALRKEYGTNAALAGVDLRVSRGEMVGLIGPNGAGKSTLLKVLATLIEPTAGSARVAGFDVVRESMEVKRRIGYAPESGFLFDALTGREFLDMAVDLKKLDRKEADARMFELAEVLGIRDVLQQPISAYSKGMRKKVSIVSALVGDPDVLILDEPVDGLYRSSVAALVDVLRSLRERMTTTILCSHMIDVVEATCDRICTLSGGVLAAEGRIEASASE